MGVVNDIYQTTLTFLYRGQVMNNVWHDKMITVGSAGTPAENLAEWYASLWANELGAVIVAQCELQTIYTVCLHDPSDFLLAPINTGGSIAVGAENGLPSVVSIGFRQARVAAGQRNGYKRFSGLDERNVTGNTWVGLGTEIEALRLKIQEPRETGTFEDNLFAPFIAHRPITLGTNPTGYLPGNVSFMGVRIQGSRRAP